MILSTRALIVLAFSAIGSTTNPKADEYPTADCSGEKDYPHSNYGLTYVTMNETTHCVYLASKDWSKRTWQAYSKKTYNGGACWGDVLGNLKGGTNNLDTTFTKRINCLLNCGTNSDSDASDKCRTIGQWVPREEAASDHRT
ncbi:hypothetical protein F5B20DRAFT_577066 [Whalleya microplaca]|nr:hypothetical protein F5B20DRAFT_577066 [Whalleya microplaca]